MERLILSTALLAAFCGSAHAQYQFGPTTADLACYEDIQRFCGDREGRSPLICLKSNMSALSAPCRAVVGGNIAPGARVGGASNGNSNSAVIQQGGSSARPGPRAGDRGVGGGIGGGEPHDIGGGIDGQGRF